MTSNEEPLQLPEVLAVKPITQTQIFHIEQISLRFSNGVTREFERLKHYEPGVVMIIPMLDAETVLLVKEYAAGIHQYSLSLPKGRVERGESIGAAANREMQEEIGYKARQTTLLRTLSSTPQYSPTLTHVVLAEGLEPSWLPSDEPEPLVVVPWPLAEITALFAREDFHEARALAAMYLLINHCQKKDR